MTTFIPEWGAASGAPLVLHRVFRRLGEEAVVRQAVGGDPCPADYFIEHDKYGWLALTICHHNYAALGGTQLFESSARTEFLGQLHELGQRLPAALPKIMILWECDEAEAAMLTLELEPGGSTVLWSRDAFTERGADALQAEMRQLAPQSVVELRRRFFPQSEIQGLTVGRRNFHRNNGATLTGVFLDREQEWASKLDLTLPDEQAELPRDFSVRLLNGVAGSGKTLVAVQRARLLAEMRPDQQVLLLIHNAPVVADLNERMHRGGRLMPPNMKICTFAKWANQQWRSIFRANPIIAPDGEVLQLIESLRREVVTPRQTDQELFEEIKFLNDALIADEAAYLAADRTGRGFALREHERSQVWELSRQVNDQLSASNMRLWSDIPREVLHARSHTRLGRLDHILVDEAQFMAPAALQLVKLALRPGGSLFLCADPRQGFLKSRLSWKSVGLDVAGRTKKLRRSYRTTAALLRAATQMLASAVDDDPDDFLAPDYAGMEQGVAPVLIAAGSPLDAIDRVVNEVGALADSKNFPLSTVTIIYGDRVSKAGLYANLCQRLGEARVWWLNRHRDKPPTGYVGEHVRLVNIDTATGMEGTFVFLVGVDGLLAAAQDDRESETRARKLYMAMTRSCYRLTVVTSSPVGLGALAELFDRR